MKLKGHPESWEARLISKYGKLENIPKEDFNGILEVLSKKDS